MGFETFSTINFEVIVTLLIAVGLGALVGFERELKHRPAGLRTHMLVSLGAAIFAIVSLSFDVEPARIAAGVVAGIGFLGAGSIIAHKGHVRGITSAATLWVVAAIGLTAGLGEYVIAIISAVFVFAILQLRRLEKKFPATSERNYEL